MRKTNRERARTRRCVSERSFLYLGIGRRRLPNSSRLATGAQGSSSIRLRPCRQAFTRGDPVRIPDNSMPNAPDRRNAAAIGNGRKIAPARRQLGKGHAITSGVQTPVANVRTYLYDVPA